MVKKGSRVFGASVFGSVLARRTQVANLSVQQLRSLGSVVLDDRDLAGLRGGRDGEGGFGSLQQTGSSSSVDRGAAGSAGDEESAGDRDGSSSGGVDGATHHFPSVKFGAAESIGSRDGTWELDTDEDGTWELHEEGGTGPTTISDEVEKNPEKSESAPILRLPDGNEPRLSDLARRSLDETSSVSPKMLAILQKNVGMPESASASSSNGAVHVPPVGEGASSIISSEAPPAMFVVPGPSMSNTSMQSVKQKMQNLLSRAKEKKRGVGVGAKLAKRTAGVDEDVEQPEVDAGPTRVVAADDPEDQQAVSTAGDKESCDSLLSPLDSEEMKIYSKFDYTTADPDESDPPPILTLAIFGGSSKPPTADENRPPEVDEDGPLEKNNLAVVEQSSFLLADSEQPRLHRASSVAPPPTLLPPNAQILTTAAGPASRDVLSELIDQEVPPFLPVTQVGVLARAFVNQPILIQFQIESLIREKIPTGRRQEPEHLGQGGVSGGISFGVDAQSIHSSSEGDGTSVVLPTTAGVGAVAGEREEPRLKFEEFSKVISTIRSGEDFVLEYPVEMLFELPPEYEGQRKLKPLERLRAALEAVWTKENRQYMIAHLRRLMADREKELNAKSSEQMKQAVSGFFGGAGNTAVAVGNTLKGAPDQLARFSEVGTMKQRAAAVGNTLKSAPDQLARFSEVAIKQLRTSALDVTGAVSSGIVQALPSSSANEQSAGATEPPAAKKGWFSRSAGQKNANPPPSSLRDKISPKGEQILLRHICEAVAQIADRLLQEQEKISMLKKDFDICRPRLRFLYRRETDRLETSRYLRECALAK